MREPVVRSLAFPFDPVGVDPYLRQNTAGADGIITGEVIIVLRTIRIRGGNVAAEILKERDGIFSICVNELRKYLEYGLPEIPSCAKSTQLELLIGSVLYGFIRTNLIPGKTPADKISRKELKDKYVDWCLTNQIDEVVIKYRYDGESRTPELARFELNRLYSAMRIMKVEEFGLNGKRYFRASFRTNPQDTLF